MIERYTRPEMGAVWSEQRKLETWLAVELAVVDALAEAGVVPAEDAATVRERASFSVEAVKEREKVTDHDVAAFVDVVAESVGEAGRWVHHGLTSSDVLDTALGLQLSQAGLSSSAGARDYRDALVRRAREHVDTLCVGRTHGVHAEPTTFGVKLAGFAFEADRNLRRLERAVQGVSVGALSGAVGTYSANGPEVEAAVLERPRASRARRCRRRWCRATATPSCWRRSRWPARGSSASPPRCATCSAPRSARSRSRSARAPEGLVGDAAQAQPDRERAHHRDRPAAARLRAGRARGRGALARARHLALLGRARGPARRDHPARLRPAPGDAGRGRDDRCTRTACGPTSTLTHGALYSQRALLALVESGRSRDDAYRMVQEDAQRA